MKMLEIELPDGVVVVTLSDDVDWRKGDDLEIRAVDKGDHVCDIHNKRTGETIPILQRDGEGRCEDQFFC